MILIDIFSDKDRYIVHFTSSQDIRVRWEEIVEMGQKVLNEKYPINDIVWYPGEYFFNLVNLSFT